MDDEMAAIERIEFPEGRIAQAAKTDFSRLPLALNSLGLSASPTLTFVGGASRMNAGDVAGLQPLFRRVWQLIEELGASALDGGTDAGLMSLMGQARREEAGTRPLIGVAVQSLVTWPGGPTEGDRFLLEANHSHFLLVPGTKWGDEARWLAEAGTVLSHGHGSLTVLVNGGDVSWLDAEYSVKARRQVLAITGTGRTADELGISQQVGSGDGRAGPLVNSGLIKLIDIQQEPERIIGLIRELLHGGGE